MNTIRKIWGKTCSSHMGKNIWNALWCITLGSYAFTPNNMHFFFFHQMYIQCAFVPSEAIFFICTFILLGLKLSENKVVRSFQRRWVGRSFWYCHFFYPCPSFFDGFLFDFLVAEIVQVVCAALNGSRLLAFEPHLASRLESSFRLQ